MSDKAERPSASKRRGHGEGSVYRRADGRWAADITVAYGRRKRVTATTKQEVLRKKAQVERERDAGVLAADERQTVGTYLESYLTWRKPVMDPGSYRVLRQNLTLHVIPHLGQHRLARLSPTQVQALYGQLLSAGEAGGGGLSSTTVHMIHGWLHHALKAAMRQGLVTRNVCDLVDAPRKARPELHPLNREEARRYLETVRAATRQWALFELAVGTGMRQGELLALKWGDVDLEATRLAVRATLRRIKEPGAQGPAPATWKRPKTDKSRRQIALSAPIVEALRRHRVEQAALRLRLGEAWADHDLVFSTNTGRPLSPSRVRRTHARILARAGLPRAVRFHDLRHTAATLLLGARVNPKVVSEMLGHASVAITLDIYSHVLPDMQQDAAAAMAAILYG